MCAPGYTRKHQVYFLLGQGNTRAYRIQNENKTLLLKRLKIGRDMRASLYLQCTNDIQSVNRNERTGKTN